jgi:hypothetical protein
MITARVNSVENTDANAKAGLMIRASNAANAPYVAILLTPGAGILLQSRSTTGGTTTVTTALPSVTAPYWLRLTRAGNTFTASYSSDGATYNFAPQVTINGFAASTLVGLATASHTTNTLSVASIGNVTVSNAAPTVVNAASANPNPVITGNTTTLSVLGADDHGEAALTYGWTVIAIPPGPPLLSLTGNNGTNASKNVVATFGRAGDYTFRVTITDAAGLQTTSTVNVTVSTVFPAVAGMTFDYHRAVAVTFNKNLGASISTDDLSLQPLAGGAAAMTPVNVTWNAATFTATFTFADDLADGDYRATLLAAGVNDTANLHPAADATFDFFAFAGDLNRDRAIDFNDLVVLAQNYNMSERTYLEGDFTGDGLVDFNDLAILAQRYNQSLGDVPPPPAAPAPSAAAAAPTVVQTPKNSLFSSTRITPPKPRPIARPARHTR